MTPMPSKLPKPRQPLLSNLAKVLDNITRPIPAPSPKPQRRTRAPKPAKAPKAAKVPKVPKARQSKKNSVLDPNCFCDFPPCPLHHGPPESPKPRAARKRKVTPCVPVPEPS